MSLELAPNGHASAPKPRPEVADHHRKIARVALRTDGELLKILPRIADHFVEAEIRQFGFDQQDDALAWLEL